MSNKVLNFRHTIKSGALLGGIMIIMWWIILATNSMSNSLGNLPLVTYIVWAILSLKQYRNTIHHGYIGFKEAFKFTFVQISFAGLLANAFKYIYYVKINPGIVAKIKDEAVNVMYQMGFPDEQIDVFINVNMAKYMFFGGIFMAIISAAIFALILAAIMKKEKPLQEL